jgi:outer membrane protein OmpA-like peptidoglycan-associated protein
VKIIFGILFFLFASACIKTYGQTTDRKYKALSYSTYEIGDRILTPQIDFLQAGGTRILPQSYDSVKVIANFLWQHPNIHVEIGVHTDSRGSIDYNLELSMLRANTIKYLLVDKFGINPNRIAIKAYGESDPLVPDEKIQESQNKEEKEALHARNRRIEMKILQL